MCKMGCNLLLQVTIRVGCPPFKIGTLAFTFTLAFDDGTEEFQGVKLNRYGMQVLTYTMNNVTFV